jgi:hypothetical protein
MNKTWFFISLAAFFLASCDGASKKISNNSSALIFSSSWEGSEVLSEAFSMHVYECREQGYVEPDEIEKTSREIVKYDRSEIKSGILALRKSISRNSASSNGMEKKYHIHITNKNGGILAYWEIKSKTVSKSDEVAYAVVFPTGGTFEVSRVDLFSFLGK